MLPLVLAQSGGTTTITDFILPAANLGLAGFFLLAFLKGWVVTPASAHEAVAPVVEERDRLRKVADRVQDEIVPAMLGYGQVIEKLTQLLTEQREWELERRAREDAEAKIRMRRRTT